MRRSDTDEIFTAPRLGAGFVAILAVGGLLRLLNHLIGETLDGNVTKAFVAARQLLRNTQALQHLKPTSQHAANLVAELERHQQQSGRKSG